MSRTITERINGNRSARFGRDEDIDVLQFYLPAESLNTFSAEICDNYTLKHKVGDDCYLFVHDVKAIGTLIRLGLDVLGMSEFMKRSKFPLNKEILEEVQQREKLFAEKRLADYLQKNNWDVEELTGAVSGKTENPEEEVLIYCMTLREAEDLLAVAKILDLDCKYGEMGDEHEYYHEGQDNIIIAFNRRDIAKHTDIVEKGEINKDAEWEKRIDSERVKVSARPAVEAMRELVRILKNRKNCSKFEKQPDAEAITAQITNSFPIYRVQELSSLLGLSYIIEQKQVCFFDHGNSPTLSMLADSGLHFPQSKLFRATGYISESVLDRPYNGPYMNGPEGPNR